MAEKKSSGVDMPGNVHEIGEIRKMKRLHDDFELEQKRIDELNDVYRRVQHEEEQERLEAARQKEQLPPIPTTPAIPTIPRPNTRENEFRRPNPGYDNQNGNGLDSDFLKEFAFVNNAQKISILFKDDDCSCENELQRFEEGEKRFTAVYEMLIVLPKVALDAASDMSKHLIELLGMNWYDIEMHLKFQDLVKFIRETLKCLREPANIFKLLNN